MQNSLIISPRSQSPPIFDIQPFKKLEQSGTLTQSGLMNSVNNGLRCISPLLSSSKQFRTPKSQISNMRVPGALTQLGASMHRSGNEFGQIMRPLSPSSFNVKKQLLYQQLRIFIRVKIEDFSYTKKILLDSINKQQPHVKDTRTPLQEISELLSKQKQRVFDGKNYINSLASQDFALLNIIYQKISLTSRHLQRMFHLFESIPQPPAIIDEFQFKVGNCINISCISHRQQKLLLLAQEISDIQINFMQPSDFSQTNLRKLNYRLVFAHNYIQTLRKHQIYDIKEIQQWFQLSNQDLHTFIMHDANQARQFLRFESANSKLLQRTDVTGITNYICNFANYLEQLYELLFDQQTIEMLSLVLNIKWNNLRKLSYNTVNLVNKQYKIKLEAYQLQEIEDLVKLLISAFIQNNENILRGSMNKQITNYLLTNGLESSYKSQYEADLSKIIFVQETKLLSSHQKLIIQEQENQKLESVKQEREFKRLNLAWHQSDQDEDQLYSDKILTDSAQQQSQQQLQTLVENTTSQVFHSNYQRTKSQLRISSLHVEGKEEVIKQPSVQNELETRADVIITQENQDQQDIFENLEQQYVTEKDKLESIASFYYFVIQKIKNNKISCLYDIDGLQLEVKNYQHLPLINSKQTLNKEFIISTGDTDFIKLIVDVDNFVQSGVDANLLQSFYSFDNSFCDNMYQFTRFGSFVSRQFWQFLDFCLFQQRMYIEDFELPAYFTASDLHLLNFQKYVQQLRYVAAQLNFLKSQQSFDLESVCSQIQNKQERWKQLFQICENANQLQLFQAANSKTLELLNIRIQDYSQDAAEFKVLVAKTLQERIAQGVIGTQSAEIASDLLRCFENVKLRKIEGQSLKTRMNQLLCSVSDSAAELQMVISAFK